MSIIIKSNKTAKKFLGTIASINTDVNTVVQAYKARVESDGGEIIDINAVTDAVKRLFNSGMYGNMHTFVGGAYGVKRDSKGGIDKLYSIDGMDLSLYIKGNAPKPTIKNKKISFSGNPEVGYTANNGAMFVSESIAKLAVKDAFGIGYTVDYSGISLQEPTAITGLVKGNVDNLQSLMFYHEVTTTSVVSFYHNSTTNLREVRSDSSVSNLTDLRFYYDMNQEAIIFRNGSNIARTPGNIEESILSDVRITLGGAKVGGANRYASIDFKEFFVAKSLTKTKASLI